MVFIYYYYIYTSLLCVHEACLFELFVNVFFFSVLLFLLLSVHYLIQMHVCVCTDFICFLGCVHFPSGTLNRTNGI